jgi:DNA modification methylase
MQYYETTIKLLEMTAGLTVNPYPLVWLKSDNAGIAPDPRRTPRQIYETALLCHRGERPIVRIVANAVAHPTEKSLHPSTKPEPVLQHFFTMLVDNTTRILDPTCGSGTALRVAEALGAEFVYGLDVDAEHVDNASVALRKARIRRNVKP